jgi:acyl-CoA synthetase (NDP forming)
MSKDVVAVVGASPRNFWTNCAIKNLQVYGRSLDVVPVTPNYEAVCNLQAVRRIGDLSGRPRAAVIAIRRDASVVAVEELVALGTPDIVLVTDGFVERGDPEGAELQRKLVDTVTGSETRLWGPNCVGFADFSAGICAIAEPVLSDVEVGPLSIVSQSGALLSAFVAAAREEGLGADFCASTGNGALLGVAEALSLAVQRATTEVIGVYMEGVAPDKVGTLQGAFDRAAEQGKRIIILKSGTSAQGSRAVLSHTASIAGTDAVFTEFLDANGVIRVDSIGAMMRVARLSVLTKKYHRHGGVSVLGGSGGAAALVSDMAEREGVDLSSFTASTIEHLTRLAGPGSFIENPLDMVGIVQQKGGESPHEVVFSDENTGVVLMPWSVQFPEDTAEQAVHQKTWSALAEFSAKHDMALVISSMATLPLTSWVDSYKAEHRHVAVVQDLDLTMGALAKLFPAGKLDPSGEGGSEEMAEAGVLSEAASRDVLKQIGVPVVSGVTVARGTDPTAVCAGLRPPFAVKVIAPVSHKARVGGVSLGVCCVADLTEVIASVESAVAAAGVPDAAIEGCLVEEMVFGREVLLGLNRDPIFGPYIVVALGGAMTEIASRSSTRLLPLAAGEAERLLSAIGISGHEAAAASIRTLCEAFVDGALAAHETVEVNPLIISAAECWAADAMVVQAAAQGAA